MRKAYLAAAVAILVAVGVMGLMFGLSPLVEGQVHRGIQNIGISGDGITTQAAVDRVEFSPLSRTLTLYGLRMRGETPQGPLSYEVAEVSLRIPLRMLLAYTPLRPMVLKDVGMMPVAENIVLRNLAVRTPEARASVQREEINEVRSQSELVGRFLDGAPIDILAATYLMGADSAHSFFISVNIPGKEGLAQLTIKESLVEGWEGPAIARMRVEELQSRLNGHESMRMASFEASNITLPDLGLVHRLMDSAAVGEEDMEAAVKTIGPVLEEILAADPPLVRQVRANGLAFSVENGSVTVEGAGFDWLSNTPRHTTSFIRNIAAPRSLIQVSTGFLAPALKADMTFESMAQSPSSHKKILTIKAENLADVDCSLTLYDAGIISTSEQALLLQSFSDLRLAVKDRGAMAWLGINISPNGLAAATVLHQTMDKGLELAPTQKNKAIREALLTFAQRPGKLEVTSAQGQRIGILQLLAALSDPGTLFTCTATPGPNSLEEQINALAAQAAQTPAPAEAAGK